MIEAEVVEDVLSWLIPAVVTFASIALAIAITAWAVSRARRSPKARAAAEQLRSEAGVALLALDDALDTLELEVALSGSLRGGAAPPSLRRARLSAQRKRDEGYEEFQDIGEPGVHPAQIRRVAARIRDGADTARASIARARAEHTQWMRTHTTGAEQIAACRSRLDQLKASMGDPAALVTSLSGSFDESEWQVASRAAHDAITALADAERRLAVASTHAQEPSRDILEDLTAAERSLRDAQTGARALEEAHRLAMQAAQALPDEVAAARNALRYALLTREALEPAAAERLGLEIRACDVELTDVEKDAARHPTEAVARIARMRDRLDAALGDSRTTQQRLRSARTALPGTLAAARTAIAQAEAALAHTRPDADARARLIAAHAELAAARQLADPVESLDAARRAMRHAEDSHALTAHGRLHG